MPIVATAATASARLLQEADILRILRFDDLAILRFGDLAILRFGDLAIWRFGDLGDLTI
jgi:hypothetical protein